MLQLQQWKGDEKVEKEIDKTIEKLCMLINNLDGENIDIISELTNALAALVTARANLEMSIRSHKKGGTIARYL